MIAIGIWSLGSLRHPVKIDFRSISPRLVLPLLLGHLSSHTSGKEMGVSELQMLPWGL